MLQKELLFSIELNSSDGQISLCPHNGTVKEVDCFAHCRLKDKTGKYQAFVEPINLNYLYFKPLRY
jgi:hypothetical protein